jgi:hypothetical protein
LVNLTTPAPTEATGMLRELQHGGGTLRRLPPGLAARAADTAAVADHVEVELV